MQVILLKDVPKVGRKFEVVEVADGYATNLLLPKKLAELATPSKVTELEARREANRAAEDAKRADLKEKLEGLKDVNVMLTAKADDQGHLYKKIHTGDIAAILKDEHDISLHDEQILLDEPIHEVGDHEVPIEAAGEKVTVTVQVVAE